MSQAALDLASQTKRRAKHIADYLHILADAFYMVGNEITSKDLDECANEIEDIGKDAYKIMDMMLTEALESNRKMIGDVIVGSLNIMNRKQEETDESNQ